MIYRSTFPEFIACAFLANESEKISAYLFGNVDPGDLERLKLNSMFKRVSIGLTQIIRSLNKDATEYAPFLPGFVIEGLGMRSGSHFQMYDKKSSKLLNFIPVESVKMTSIQTQNIKIWSDEYTLLLWELEIRNMPNTKTGFVQ